MVTTTPDKTQISLTEFLQIPETEPASDYIEGEIYQKPMPQGEHSAIQGDLTTAINQIGQSQKLASPFLELRCTFGGGSVVPDITVFEWERIPRQANGRIANWFEIAPDWTIEILSPEQRPNRVIKKIAFCLKHGTKLGWFIDPKDESVTIFEPNKNPEFKSGQDILPVLGALGDWQLSVVDLFSCLYL